ncbi:hypothetical protein Q428_12150 [Fervidicella metallireducens AeB]|uniref:Rubredoxin n=1 Tax=Fervidicella metallireducens AeB TaxID=1403537 RepID=A0A017RUU2_9CLOT|nr:rubredoxin [Fervidicella metallireducens]EYE87660.1 hypothetical protein Q428_12150 [Fervidicella metallireducens AeB]
MNYIGHFGFKSGRDINKFTGVKYELSKKGVPYTTEYSGGWIEAEVIEKIDVETHTVFIGKVLDGEVLGEDEPLTYANYHRIKKGQRLTAAVVTKETDSKTDKVSDKILYRCNICGYVYDMETGDPSSNVLPGTPFEDIDDEWVCPVCGVSKKNFEKI